MLKQQRYSKMEKALETEVIRAAVERVRTLMPKQGPIDIFVHHNTLHDFENLDFHEAICKVSSIKKSKTYKEHDSYVRDLVSGRISDSVLRHIWKKNGVEVSFNLQIEGYPPYEIFKKILCLKDTERNIYTIKFRLTSDLEDLTLRNLETWFNDVSNHNKLFRLSKDYSSLFVDSDPVFGMWEDIEKSFFWRDKKSKILNEEQKHLGAICLWKTIYEKLRCLDRQSIEKNHVYFDKDLLGKANRITFEYLSAYFDRGISYWPIDSEHRGVIECFIENWIKQDFKIPFFLRNFSTNIHHSTSTSMYSNKLLNQLLSKFNVGYEQIDDFFFALLDDVQGWAALFCDYEQKGKGVCLQDLLTLRLIIFDALGMNSCYKFQSKLIPASDAVSDTCLMFDLLCSLELEPNGINEFIDYLPSIFNVVSPFFDVDRRCQVLHQAYELSYYSKVASAIIKKKEDAKERDQTFAAIFCIDDREESLRRHLEEVDSKCSTYGYAGFFNIEMLFKSSRLKHAVALCPVSIKPTRVIEEKIISENSFKKSIFKYFETLRRLMYVKSKSAFFGAVLHFSLLIFTVLGDLMRFLSPQVYSFFVKKLRKSVQTGFMTDLEIKRSENLSIDAFSDEEIADKISLLLRTIGLVENFPKIIFIIGHGSTSLNNPHESAYDCGACSGQRGGPNARVFAKLANEKGVRKALANKGIELQPETIFVGGYHDTSSDKIEFFDLEKIPKSLTVTFEQYIATFYQASKLDAHERSRRFHSIPFGTPGFALKKVEARSLKYAQPRPECGHATNALCIIGK